MVVREGELEDRAYERESAPGMMIRWGWSYGELEDRETGVEAT